jgi:hypothetical protein
MPEQVLLCFNEGVLYWNLTRERASALALGLGQCPGRWDTPWQAYASAEPVHRLCVAGSCPQGSFVIQAVVPPVRYSVA